MATRIDFKLLRSTMQNTNNLKVFNALKTRSPLIGTL